MLKATCIEMQKMNTFGAHYMVKPHHLKMGVSDYNHMEHNAQTKVIKCNPEGQIRVVC